MESSWWWFWSATPAPLKRERPTLWGTLRELALVLGVTFAYFLTRGLARGTASNAFQHAQQLLNIEQTLHLNPEYALQALALHHDWLMQAANLFYIAGHLPVLIGVAAWLYWSHHQAYLRFRTAFLLSALIGLSIYIIYPVAPPRFLPGFTDTLKVSGFNVDGSAVGAFYNPYAAMPSLHVGWALLAGLAIMSYAPRWWLKVLGALLPLCMMLTVLMTGNHYLLDTLAGMSIVVISLACATYWYAWRAKRQQRRLAAKLAETEREQQQVAVPVGKASQLDS
jgi:membrane-associated phospholipid phosphatase